MLVWRMLQCRQACCRSCSLIISSEPEESAMHIFLGHLCTSLGCAFNKNMPLSITNPIKLSFIISPLYHQSTITYPHTRHFYIFLDYLKFFFSTCSSSPSATNLIHTFFIVFYTFIVKNFHIFTFFHFYSKLCE